MRLTAFVLMVLSAAGAQTTIPADWGRSARYPNESYKVVEVANGIHAFIAPEPNSGVVQGNITLIVGEDAAMLMDSGQFPLFAEKMIADIRRITTKPVKYLVNTHWHGDHLLANGAFKKAWPQLTIVSTGFTKRKIAEIYTQKFISEQPQQMDATVKHIRTRVSEGKFSSGKVMTADQKKFWTDQADIIEHVLPELKSWQYVPPEMAYEKELVIDLGKREVKLMWLGRGNTGGDTITWIEDTKTLITGDTVVYPTPYGFGSYYSEWPAVLQKMIEMKAAAIVPGHGPVMKDYAYFHHLIALFNDISKQVKDRVAQGQKLEQIQKEVTLADWKQKLAGNNKLRQADFDNYLVQPAIPRAYQEATGTMKEEGMQ